MSPTENSCADCGITISPRSTRCRNCAAKRNPGRPPGPELPPRYCPDCNDRIGPRAEYCKHCSANHRSKRAACSDCGKNAHFVTDTGQCSACRAKCPGCGAHRTNPKAIREGIPCRSCRRQAREEIGELPPHKQKYCECGNRRSINALRCRECHLKHYSPPGVGCRVKKCNVDGYVYVPAPPGHPSATKSGRIAEHRLVMEKVLGRPLLPGETPHHRNGLRSDNRPENLELWDRSQPAGQRVVDRLLWAIGYCQRYGFEVSGNADLVERLGAPELAEAVNPRSPRRERPRGDHNGQQELELWDAA